MAPTIIIPVSYLIIPNHLGYVLTLLLQLSAMFCFEGIITHWVRGSLPQFSYLFPEQEQ